MTTGFMQRFKGKIKASELWVDFGTSSVRGLFDALSGTRMGGVWTNAGSPTNGGAGTLATFAQPGDLLLDITNKVLYQNTNTQASPTWTALATNSLPSGATGTFGGGSGTFGLEGNLSKQISSAGINPGATGADNVLAVYSIPAGSFAAAGQGIDLIAMGSFAANGNTKRIKIIFNPTTAVVGSTVGTGGTTIADTGAVVTNSGGWALEAEVFKYGAGGSNTQIGFNLQNLAGAAAAALLAPALSTATESGAILVAVTGNATTTATDIALNLFQVNGMN